MRHGICGLTILVCLAATAGISYLHGFDRVLGRDEWRFETRFMKAYAREIPFHAGPLGVLALAALLGVRSARTQRVVLAAVVVVAGLAVYETHESVRAYILATPGQLVSSPALCDDLLMGLWLGSLGVLAWVVFAGRRDKPTP